MKRSIDLFNVERMSSCRSTINKIKRQNIYEKSEIFFFLNLYILVAFRGWLIFSADWLIFTQRAFTLYSVSLLFWLTLGNEIETVKLIIYYWFVYSKISYNKNGYCRKINQVMFIWTLHSLHRCSSLATKYMSVLHTLTHILMRLNRF